MTANMTDARTVEDHYTRGSLGDTILAALRAAGKDPEHLTTDDLAPVDEFHSGQRNATVRLAQLARVAGSEDVLDVGCGIGGPSRFLAKQFGCRVTGLDLTAEFVEVATMLALRTGLAERVAYRQGNALELPFEDASFDLVWSQNAAMNIADRDRLYGEMHRVLRPKGRLAIQDVAAGPGGEPYYPTPWAKDPSMSFLFAAPITREKLERAGFRVSAWHDPTAESLEQALARAKALEGGTLPPLGIHILIGPNFPTVSKNMVRNLEERRIQLINAVLERKG
jgi:ubiquinone/menaquinone biosynthesis C-methylase UbiE